MTPEAIMTPGGIADQFTRGLSGVAQAFAQRSAIDRQAKQDALAQIRAEQEQERSQAYLAMAQADRERQARNDAIAEEDRIRRIKGENVALNPSAYTSDPLYGSHAAALLDAQYRAKVQADFNIGKSGMPLLGTDAAPVGSYIPEDKQAQVAGYNIYNAAQELAKQKISGKNEHKLPPSTAFSAMLKRLDNIQKDLLLTDVSSPEGQALIHERDQLSDTVNRMQEAYTLSAANYTGGNLPPKPTIAPQKDQGKVQPTTTGLGIDDPSIWK